MQFFATKFLVSISLIFSMLASSVAQEERISFTWLDRSERTMSGYFTAILVPQQQEDLYRIDYSVTWMDQDGQPLGAASAMPYLCLSKYDFDMLPAQALRCTSFERNKLFSLTFQTSGSLFLQVQKGYTGEISLIARFHYALTLSEYETGKSELIELSNGHGGKITFTVKPRVKAGEPVVDAGSSVKKLSISPEAIRTAAVKFENLRNKVRDFESRKSDIEFSRPDYQSELDVLTANIETERDRLDPDSLPADTILHYRELYNQLNDSVLDLRTSYWKFRMSQSATSDAAGQISRLKATDSLGSLLRERILPIVQRQVDSLSLISGEQKLIATQISVIIPDSKGNYQDNPRLDSLIKSHGSLKTVFQNLRMNHDNVWNGYRMDVYGLKPVQEIENLHSVFAAGEKEMQSAIDQVDTVLSVILPGTDDTPWYMSNRMIWIGLLVVLVLVFVSTIWSSARSRQILRERLASFQTGISGPQPAPALVSGIFTSEVPSEYYTISYEETIPESVVGKIHYHTSAVKSVYHLVQGALLERKGVDFGGYLFGNQYKLHGKGAVKSELFIEKVCDSKYLRAGIPNDISARADLIDELDELVRQNKKYRLIGWFTSSIDASMEVPEGLMKIHRTFFKEKWQVGILLNPGSDLINGACFLRRKSGYLDPMPDPAAFVKWEELYRYALNPVSSSKMEQEFTDKSEKDYSRIELNNTWGDSIVTAANFDPAAVKEITAAAANQAIPKDTFQVVGYLYGSAALRTSTDGKDSEYEVFIDRFIELRNEVTPREIPGYNLIGWWGQANVDIINYLQSAVDYHEQVFREAYHIACLVNPVTGELRIFTRKHSLEMNNNTIETEEYSLKSLLSR